MHWADKYVGLQGEGETPCWLLVRRVWQERLGVSLPRFDGTDDPESVFKHEAVARGFREIEIGQEIECDAVMMNVPVKTKSGVKSREQHIGVVVAKGLALHIKANELSCIEPFAVLRPTRILRGPWG